MFIFIRSGYVLSLKPLLQQSSEKRTVAVGSIRCRTEGLDDLLHFVLQHKHTFWWMNTSMQLSCFCVASPSSSDLVITAAAQVVGQGGIRVGRRWRWCHFLWHARLVRRLFEHGVQAAVCPVVRSRLQAQQVWVEKEEQSEMYRKASDLWLQVRIWLVTLNWCFSSYIKGKVHPKTKQCSTCGAQSIKKQQCLFPEIMTQLPKIIHGTSQQHFHVGTVSFLLNCYVSIFRGMISLSAQLQW